MYRLRTRYEDGTPDDTEITLRARVLPKHLRVDSAPIAADRARTMPRMTTIDRPRDLPTSVNASRSQWSASTSH